MPQISNSKIQNGGWPKSKTLKSDTANVVMRKNFWLYLHNRFSDLRRILLRKHNTDSNDGRISQILNIKMADGYAPKRYGRRCYNNIILLGAWLVVSFYRDDTLLFWTLWKKLQVNVFISEHNVLLAHGVRIDSGLGAESQDKTQDKFYFTKGPYATYIAIKEYSTLWYINRTTAIRIT